MRNNINQEISKKSQRKPNRLSGFDYSSPGYYFVTICAQIGSEMFGTIESGVMKLNRFGKIANQIWMDIPYHYSNAELDEFVIMPNHIHGIIIIDDNVGTEQCSVPTESNQNHHYGLLSKITKSFKEIFVKQIRKQYQNYDFKWQRSFYDRIIRNEKELYNIRQYIINNPLKWQIDNNNPKN
jgi:REP element-mobilizing transposase RayT